MFSGLLAALLDSVVKYGFSFFAAQMDKRSLLAQGAQNQVVKDQVKALDDVAAASSARASVDGAVAADPSLLRAHDAFERR